MAERRMFAKTIIDSDMFLDMPVTAQLLYFHLCMRADDDGFINNPKRIMRDVRCGDDDMKMLIAKKYIIPFESGVVVIKHWRIHNYIQKDRYKPSILEERKALTTNDTKAYEVLDTECIHDGYTMDTTCTPRLGKVRLDNNILSGKPDDEGEQKNIAYAPIVHEVVDYLNQKVGAKYKYTSKNTVAHIKARVNEGFTVEDFKTVIDNKSASWLGNKDMEKYLRPETLFGTKFEGYLNEKPKKSDVTTSSRTFYI